MKNPVIEMHLASLLGIICGMLLLGAGCSGKSGGKDDATDTESGTAETSTAPVILETDFGTDTVAALQSDSNSDTDTTAAMQTDSDTSVMTDTASEIATESDAQVRDSSLDSEADSGTDSEAAITDTGTVDIDDSDTAQVPDTEPLDRDTARKLAGWVVPGAAYSEGETRTLRGAVSPVYKSVASSGGTKTLIHMGFSVKE